MTLGDISGGWLDPELCVWSRHIKGEDIVATVHGDDITIGGERSAVELFIRMISKKVRDQEESDR